MLVQHSCYHSPFSLMIQYEGDFTSILQHSEDWVGVVVHNRHGTQSFNIDIIKPDFIKEFRLLKVPEVVVSDTPSAKAKFRLGGNVFQSMDKGTHNCPRLPMVTRLSPTQQVDSFTRGGSHLLIHSEAVPKGSLYGALETHDHYVCLEDYMIISFRLSDSDIHALPVYKPQSDYFVGAGGTWVLDEVKHTKIVLKLEIGHGPIHITRVRIVYQKGVRELIHLHIETERGETIYEGLCEPPVPMMDDYSD